jgi:Domain of unknown function (DUF5047)
MLAMSSAAASLVTGSYTLHVRAESWQGNVLLTDEIPIDGGSEEVDASLNVPERITLTVPRTDRGVSWVPTGTDHPLAPYGQRLKIELGIELGNGQIEWLQRGWFLITDSEVEGDSVRVQAGGLLSLIDEARFVSPYQPTGTFTSTLRGLIEPAVTAEVTGLTDRAVPASMEFDEDRLAAVYELLDAWPARARVDEHGVLQVVPDTDGASVLALTDGTGGTVIRTDGGDSRGGAYTVVVARGQAADGAQLQGVVYDTSPGPLRYGGPFNPLPVPYFYFSPLLNTVGECRAAAATILARLRRAATHSVHISLVPHLGLQEGDVVTVTSAVHGLDAVPCVIDTLSLPYVPDGGPMTLEARRIDA